jgi:DNA-binding NarL/FixJ family response regulator
LRRGAFSRAIPLRQGSLQGGIVEPGCNTRLRVVNELKQPAIRILVAEDHPVVADGIAAVLELAKDMTIVGRAKDGGEAIELLKQHRPDIVLLDLRMPVVDGMGVANWIRRSGLSTRIIILTMFRSESDVRQAMHAGANAYLLKDASAREILRTIRRVHRGEASISRVRAKELAPNVNSADLQPLEVDILALIVEGHDNRTIGSRLGLGTDAVKYHLRGLFSKLGVKKRASAARQAIERGLLERL